MDLHLSMSVQDKVHRQKQAGDGHFRDRGVVQDRALRGYQKAIYRRFHQMEVKAENSARDWTVKLRDQRAACDQQWQALQENLCAIGERYRDQHWLTLHSKAMRDETTKLKDRVEAAALLPSPFNAHRRFIQDHLGAIVDQDIQAYLQAVNRVAELWPKIRPQLDFYSLMLPQSASYRGSDGRPWPPIAQCDGELKALRPKLSLHARQRLMIAWCLRPFTKNLV